MTFKTLSACNLYEFYTCDFRGHDIALGEEHHAGDKTYCFACAADVFEQELTELSDELALMFAPALSGGRMERAA
jgi:hypothetical protein